MSTNSANSSKKYIFMPSYINGNKSFNPKIIGKLLPYVLIPFLFICATGKTLAQSTDQTLLSIKAEILENPHENAFYIKLLNYAEQNGKLNEAISILNEIHSAQPENVSVLHTLGYCYQQIGDTPKTIESWKKALRMNPQLEFTSYELARLFVREKNLKDAMLVVADYCAATPNLNRFDSPQMLQLMVDVLHGYIREVEKKAINISEAERRQMLKLIYRIFIVFSTIQAKIMMPEFDKYSMLKPPARNELIPVKRFESLAKNAAAVFNLYMVYGLLSAREHLDYMLAEHYFREALTITDPVKYPAANTQISGNLAQVLETTGRYQDATGVYAAVIASGETLIKQTPNNERNRITLANNYFNASKLYWKQGKVSESLSRLYKAQEHYIAVKFDSENLIAVESLVSTTSELIDRNLSLNNVEQASNELQKLSVVLARADLKLFMPYLSLVFDQLDTEISLQMGNIEHAENAYQKLRKRFESSSDFEKRFFPKSIELEIGLLELRVLWSKKQYQELLSKSMNFIAEIRETEQKLGVRVKRYWIETCLLAIKTYIARKQYKDVDKIINLLETLLGENDPNNWKADALSLRARLSEETGDIKEAEKAYQQMVSYLAGLRGQMPVTDDLYQSEQRLFNSYSSYINFLLSQKNFPAALEIFEQARTQTLIRSLQQKSIVLQNQPGETSRDLSTFQRLAWERYSLIKQIAAEPQNAALQEQLNQVTVGYRAAYQRSFNSMSVSSDIVNLNDLLNKVKNVDGFIVIFRVDEVENLITSWWIKEGRIIKAETRPIEWNKINGQLKEFVEMTAGMEYESAEGVLLPILGEKLLDAILPDLRSLPPNSKLTIIPDSKLQDLSFASLYINGEPVIKEKLVGLSYAPSLNSLAYFQTKFPAPPKNNALFIGFRSAGSRFPPLSYVEKDARDWQKIFADSKREATVVLSEHFTKQSFKNAFANQGLVVFGSHGVLDPENPMKGFIALPSDDQLLAFEVFELPLEGSFVILSACQVGRDVGAPNQDILGMTFPIFTAGARSVMHAQWAVDETATSQIMNDVLRAFAGNESIDSALIKAQRNYLNSASPLGRHPKFWAPWRIVGKNR